MPKSRAIAYRQYELQNDFRARLWQQFAVLERSGIPILQALPILAQAVPAAYRPRLERLLSLLRGGLSLSQAGQRSGVWLPWEASVLGAAEHSGRRELFYQRLTQYYTSRATRLRKLKARMLYPYAVFIFALVLGPLPALAQGAIDGTGYLARTLLPLLLLFASQALLIAQLRRWRAGLQGMPAALSGLAYLRRQQQRDGLALLALLLQAGLAAHDACACLRQHLQGDWLQQRLRRMQNALRQGAGVTEALAQGNLLPDSQAEQLIASGELAGRLEASLQQVVNDLDRQLDEQLDSLAEWLPRLVYALVVGFVISRLL